MTGSNVQRLGQKAPSAVPTQEGNQKARVFALTREEVTNAEAVVTGTVLVCNAPAYVLFDSGSSQTFISTAFVRQTNLELAPLGFLLLVSTPSGSVMISSQMVKVGWLSFDGQKLGARLIQLDIRDFDVILGMDWLATNQASINCSKKEVSFQLPFGWSFMFKGVTGGVPRIVSALRARHLLQGGAWGFLASVVDTHNVTPSIDSVHVVNEFHDVFPKNLSGLPPVRELDFCIDLFLGTTPISKAPYRMTPAELKELKA
ncbi:uncharacterized protein LOC111021593 [Momordica charantia]|uniref:Uncharacterized protein LOC111021593 n=1 Tax=Momordica charantia TaxID=3673 RepID=A0A6J1DLN2_MOMCH|nr:uncharacterized protein LOC111021593 [Momordica charantia]